MFNATLERTSLYRRLRQAYANGSLKLVKRIHALLALPQGKASVKWLQCFPSVNKPCVITTISTS